LGLKLLLTYYNHQYFVVFCQVMTQQEATSEDSYKKDVFLIYAGKDEEVVKKIFDGLSGQGLHCAAQFDTKTFHPGKSIMESISKFIMGSKRTVLVLTMNALESTWISLEIILALEQSQQRKDQDLALRLLLVDTDKEKEKDLKIGHLAKIPHRFVDSKDNDWKSLKDWIQGIAFFSFYYS